MKTEDRATPLFTATAFVAVSAALFFLSGCSADSSIAGASEEESTVSAEAVNQGTALARGQVSSETVVFGEVTDPRDGQKYRTVKIGKNTWFAENLNYETANSWCYNDEESNCDMYGRLYTHADAANACPEGWALPTMIQYMELYMNTANSNGFKTNASMLIATGSRWGSPFEGGEKYEFRGKNPFGFSIIAAGRRTSDGNFEQIDASAYLWTLTASSRGGYVAQNYVTASPKDAAVEVSYIVRTDAALSVRCIKR